ncbi:hypothetical protein LPB140_08410 [Sphingorhabdus lutea]|uniref:SPOR domain-containing protein n=2 Tax=Sphingorhabdus lutea TaxID=1913578 RepID=A0A1L3JF44_9SPHN|nr:hypothetical protein LPB140_08410 [Sphingorhabdus lutea]
MAACSIALCASAFILGNQPAMAFQPVKEGVDAWTKGEYEAAVNKWKQPALNGDADAQFNLAQAYKLGRGVEANVDTALIWYGKAAAQGHLQASDNYGHMLHYKGKIAESIPYLSASAARGQPLSQYLYATELFNGTFVQKDWVRAYAFMTRASTAGLPYATKSLGQMDGYISLEDRQKGTVMAGDIEQQEKQNRSQAIAGLPIDTSPAAPIGKPISLPPSNIPVQPPISAPANAPVNAPINNAGNKGTYIPSAPVRSAPVTAQPVSTSPQPSSASPMPSQPAIKTAANGKWRVQLGAFSKQSSAEALWFDLENKLPELKNIQPFLVPAGTITRLQAGPFASRAEADKLCNKMKNIGQACLSMSK